MDPLEGCTAPIDDETQRFLDLAQPLIDQIPAYETMTIQEVRDRTSSNPLIERVHLDNGIDRTIPGPDGDVPVRIFVPDQVNGVYLHFHGGGWVGGDIQAYDPVMWARAQEAGVAVITVGYRLAPEHPYPAGWDDCEAAALWTIEHAKAEFGAYRIVIGGESAGAHLTAATLLRLRDRHGYTGIAGAEMRYGLYDMRLTPSVRLDTGILNAKGISWLMDHAMPEEHRESPDGSPLLYSLHGMPPALFICGTRDSLLDDTLFMWTRWRAAGNDAELRIYPGGIHAFDAMPIPIAADAVETVARFIKERVTS